MSELKKCPFCGGDNVGLWENKSISPIIPKSYEVRCYDCHFGYVQRKTKEEAISSWNTRKPVERILERLEEEKSDWNDDYNVPINKAIKIVKEEVE